MSVQIRIAIPDVVENVKERVQKTLDVIYDKLIEVTSADKYTEKELRRLRPYSRAKPLDTSPLVHRRTGRLQDAIKKEINGLNARIVLDTKKSPHIEYVYYGTRKMVPRKFIDEAIERAIPEIQRIWRD